MAKRQRIDSISAEVEVMKKSALELCPPDHVPLTEADYPFWRSILAEKAKSEWTGHDLEIAALLARAMRKLEKEEASLDSEDAVVTTVAGNLAANPRIRIILDLHARVIKYRQTLGIHSRGKDGEARDVAKRRDMARGIEAGNPLDDDLLARPSIQ